MSEDRRAGGDARRLYGRRRSHKLRPGRQALIASQADALRLTDRDPEGALRAISPPALFGEKRPCWLEIGFGGGEHLAATAKAHPDIGFIGCEHYVDGVAKMLAAIEKEALTNVRVHAHDARDVMDALPAASIARAFVLYPDPWPKKRHARRRFINGETLDAFERILAPGAELRIASDIPDYIAHCLAALAARRRRGATGLRFAATRADDWRRPWAGWPGTRYEAKALREGRTPTYLTFVRSSGPA